jgi:hypothetical protein
MYDSILKGTWTKNAQGLWVHPITRMPVTQEQYLQQAYTDDANAIRADQAKTQAVKQYFASPRTAEQAFLYAAQYGLTASEIKNRLGTSNDTVDLLGSLEALNINYQNPADGSAIPKQDMAYFLAKKFDELGIKKVSDLSSRTDVIFNDNWGTTAKLTGNSSNPIAFNIDYPTKLGKQLAAAGLIDPSSSGGAWTTHGFGFEGMLSQIGQRLYNQTGVTDINQLEGVNNKPTFLKGAVVRPAYEVTYDADLFNGLYYPIYNQVGYEYVTEPGNYEEGIKDKVYRLTPQEASTVRNISDDPNATFYTADFTAPVTGFVNKQTGQYLGRSIDLGGWGQGQGMTYARINFGNNGKPTIISYGRDSSDLGAILPFIAFASFMIPGGPATVGSFITGGAATGTTAALIGSAAINFATNVALGASPIDALKNTVKSVGASYVGNMVGAMLPAELQAVGSSAVSQLIQTGKIDLTTLAIAGAQGVVANTLSSELGISKDVASSLANAGLNAIAGRESAAISSLANAGVRSAINNFAQDSGLTTEQKNFLALGVGQAIQTAKTGKFNPVALLNSLAATGLSNAAAAAVVGEQAQGNVFKDKNGNSYVADDEGNRLIISGSSAGTVLNPEQVAISDGWSGAAERNAAISKFGLNATPAQYKDDQSAIAQGWSGTEQRNAAQATLGNNVTPTSWQDYSLAKAEGWNDAQDKSTAIKQGWTDAASRNTAVSTLGSDASPSVWNKLKSWFNAPIGQDNLANTFKSNFGKAGSTDQFYEFGLDPTEFSRIDTIDDALKAVQSAFVSDAINAFAKGQMTEQDLRSELSAGGISASNVNTLVNVAKDSLTKQDKTNAIIRDLLDPGSDLSLESASQRLKSEVGLSDSQVGSLVQSITSDFSRASEVRKSADQIIDDYTSWNSDLSRDGALQRLVSAGVAPSRANELLGLVDSQVESQRYLKEVGREAVQRYAAGDISREDAELALTRGLFPKTTADQMITYANAIKEGRQLTPGEMEVAAINNLNQWFNVGSGYQVRVARAEDGTLGLTEVRDNKGNNVTNAFLDPYTNKLSIISNVPERVATASNVQSPVSYAEFQRLINPQAIGNMFYDKESNKYYTVDDNGNRLLTMDPTKLPVATVANYQAYLMTWGILQQKGLPLPDPKAYATTTASTNGLPPLLQTVADRLSVPINIAGNVIGSLGAALETFGMPTSKMTEFGQNLIKKNYDIRSNESIQAQMRVEDRFRTSTNNSERGRAILNSFIEDPGASLRFGGVELGEEMPSIAMAVATGGGSALVQWIGRGSAVFWDAVVESYGGQARDKINEGISKGLTREQAVKESVEDASKAGGITFLANALANKIPFGGTATKEILKNAFIQAPEEFFISKALGDDTNTALNKLAFALMISPTADAGLRSSGGVVNLVATPQGLQATYADGAKITIGERDGQVTTAYDLPTTNLINNLVTDALASNQSLPTVINEQFDILSNVNISDFMPTIVSAASNYANPEDITNALITASIDNGSFDQSLLTSVINSSLDIPGATDQRVIDSAIGAMLAANQTPQVIANSMFTSGLNSGLSYNTALNDVTSSLLAKSTDPAATLGQIIPIASQVGLTAGQTPADVANAVFNTALQAGNSKNLNATENLGNAIDLTYDSLISAGLTSDQASGILGVAANQAGTNNNLSTADILTSINTGIAQAGGNVQVATTNVLSGQLTGLQTQYNQLSADQKAQYDALTAEQKTLADNLAAQGVDLNQAINQAKTELKTDIGNVKSELTTEIDNIRTQLGTKIDTLAQTSADADKVLNDSITGVARDLGITREELLTKLGTTEANLKTEFTTQLAATQDVLQKQIAAQTAQQQEDARLQRIATGSAAAMALPGLIGQPTKQPFLESPLVESKIVGGYIDPLGLVKKEIEPDQEVKPPLGGEMNTFTYGKEPPSYDQLFAPPGNEPVNEFEQAEEMILPYRQGGAPLNIQMMYAKGGREDYRGGKEVAGPGDGQSDDIPAWLADGEYVLDAEIVSALGNGSTKAGTQLLDEFRRQIRAHKRGGALSSIPPESKSIDHYFQAAQRKIHAKRSKKQSPLDYLKG